MTAGEWSWHWAALGTSGSFGDNPVFDWVRVFLIVLAGWLVLMIARIIVEQTRRKIGLGLHQMFGFAFSIIAAISIALTEIDVMGTVATPRLLINTVAMLCGVLAMHLTRRHQRGLEMS